MGTVHGVVPLRETYAIGGKFLIVTCNGQDEHGGTEYDGGDRSGPLPDYDHRTRLLVVGAVVLDRA